MDGRHGAEQIASALPVLTHSSLEQFPDYILAVSVLIPRLMIG